MNYYPKLENLKPIRDTQRAKELGRLGGIASGKTRKRKSIIKQKIKSYSKLNNYINSLTNKEYESFLNNFTEEQKEKINFLFKSNIRLTKRGYKVIIKGK